MWAAAPLIAAGEVDTVLVGAHRIAEGERGRREQGRDVRLALAADRHGVPLVVVAPTSTLDRESPTGAAMPIEERDPAEVSSRYPARNPAFDVTPASLVAAIVTEEGVHRPPYEEHSPR